ncbi:MAG TPA: barstar family protein [Bacillota bacterium]|nr:barstar family protein [Bacillota bacterium]
MKIIIDGSLLKGRDAYHTFIKESLQLPDYYGRNLDALYDLLSVTDEHIGITVRHLADMREDLGTYADQLLSTLQDAVDVNPRVTLLYCPDDNATAQGHEIDAKVMALQAGAPGIDDFIAGHESYIKSRLRGWSNRVTENVTTETDSADLWSIALSAFAEAIQGYDRSRGAFYAFAALVIDRRLTDHYRYLRRHRREVSIDPAILQANPGDSDAYQATAITRVIIDKLSTESDDRLALEIDAAGLVFSTYGFSFFDLASASPKAEKTKHACALAVSCMLNSPVMLSELRSSRQLPIKILEKRTGVPRKTLERHRKYIVAAIEILDGEFPGLAGYMRHIKRGKQQ